MADGTHFPLHFMTTMLAAILADTPLLVYNTGFQLSVQYRLSALSSRRRGHPVAQETSEISG